MHGQSFLCLHALSARLAADAMHPLLNPLLASLSTAAGMQAEELLGQGWIRGLAPAGTGASVRHAELEVLQLNMLAS